MKAKLHEFARKNRTLTDGLIVAAYISFLLIKMNQLLNQLPSGDPSQGMTSTQSSAFQAMLVGIGRGIGNIAAHELGHQFGLTYMDCDKPADSSTSPPTPAGPACPEGGPHNNLYEYYSDSLPQYSYVGAPLHWASADDELLSKKLVKR